MRNGSFAVSDSFSGNTSYELAPNQGGRRHTLSKRKLLPSMYFSFLVRIIASVLLEDNVFEKKPKRTILLINEMDKRDYLILMYC